MRLLHLYQACLCCLCVLVLTSDSAPHRLEITVTAYSHTGRRSAAGVVPTLGTIALSRDVERALHVCFGDAVVLEGLGTYIFSDRMPRQWRKRADVYVTSAGEAQIFGIKRHVGIRPAKALSRDQVTPCRVADHATGVATVP